MKTTHVYVCGSKGLPESLNTEFYINIIQSEKISSKLCRHFRIKQGIMFFFPFSEIGCKARGDVVFIINKAIADPKGLVHTEGSLGKRILYVWFVTAVTNAHNSANWECNYRIWA